MNMVNFAKRAAVVSTTNLEQTAQNIARGKGPDTFLDTASITPDVWDSMKRQGMADSNAWGPGAPIAPSNPIDTEPRQFEYMIGQNIVQRPRSTENVGFDTIRSIIEMYDVAQLAIEVRQDELRNLDWNIVPIDEKDTDKYASECNSIRRFFEKPDGTTLFDDFQNMLAYDWLAYDALTIYPHATKGGKLGALEVVDGTTITPMMDYFGRIPEAPAPAYVQWTNGLPWVWLNRDQLIYRPNRRRSNKLYGFSPVEWLLNNINTDIRYQLYFLQYFTEGTIPDTWINAPQEMQDPGQIEALQNMFDAVMSGKQGMKHKAKFIPFGANVHQAKDNKVDVAFQQFLLTKTCAAFKVTPAEIGFTEKVNKSSGESQENVQFRRSIRPAARFFESIYTGIIAKYFGLPNLKFKFLNLDEQEDLLVMAQRDELYIKNGVVSPDEIRVQRLGLEVDASNPVPRGFLTYTGFTPVETAIQTAEASLEQTKATIATAQAQAEAMREQVKEQKQADGDTSTDTEDESADDLQPENGNADGVKDTIAAETNAEKAMLDFFPRRLAASRIQK